MNGYEAKQEARRERLQAAASKARRNSEAAHARVRSIADNIPFGQPILVGHHSEKHARRDAKRIDDGMRRAVDEQNRAEDLERRAASIGTGGISSDDPDAIDKLREKLAAAEAEREQMKAINATYRAAAKRETDSAAAIQAGWKAVLKMVGAEAGTKVMRAARFNDADVPYPSYALTNAGGRIRQIKDRIAGLEGATTRAVAMPFVFTGGRVVEREDLNRIAIQFDARLTADEYSTMKRHGWRWSPTEKAFLRHLNEAGRAAARYTLQQLGRTA